MLGADTYERVPVPMPEPPPERWNGLLGEFGWDHNTLYIYGTGVDGYVYWKHYDGTTWSPWFEVGDETTSAYEIYALDWGGYDNVFWTSDDGNVYWNRWDGSAWTGTTALPGDVKLKYAPTANPYEPEKALYAYSVTAKGEPAWNSQISSASLTRCQWETSPA